MKNFLLMPMLALLGCVAHIPIEEQSPDLTYVDPDLVLVSIIDQRNLQRPDIGADVIGKAHGTFGIPSAMKTYPWYESDKEKKSITLAQALEERLIIGLNDEGWTVKSAGFTTHPTVQQVRETLLASNAQNLLLIVLNDWYVSVNLNWVGGENFDWATTVKIFGDDGSKLLEQTSGTRHVIPPDGSESYPNLIRRAFRDRLEEILETPEVQSALVSNRSYDSGMEDSTLGNSRYKLLLELDELRDKGILTEEEFEMEKRKLLQGEEM
jgi:hypothetical protein